MKKLSVLCALCFVLCTFGYTSEDLSSANYLGEQKIVTTQTDPKLYRLDDKILRQEVIGMALKIKGITLPENYKCKKYFTDATKNDWVCRAVEIAADNGMVARNKNTNPEKYITRAEALAIIMKAGGYKTPSGATPAIFPYSDVDTSSWQADLVVYAAGLGIITNPNIIPLSEGYKITDTVKPIKFYPNREAARAEVFGFAKNMIHKPISSCSTAGEDAWYEDYSGENHLKSCCGGLKSWDSGMDTRISVGNTCYETGDMAGSLRYTCLACGDNICSDIETPCNCPQDCKNGQNADYATIADFCASAGSGGSDPWGCQYMDLPLCHLCQ